MSRRVLSRLELIYSVGLLTYRVAVSLFQLIPADDGKKLFRDFGIVASNLVELSAMAKQADPGFEQSFGPNRMLVSLAKVSTLIDALLDR